MKGWSFWSVNIALAVIFILVLRRKGLLSYHRNGRWWLTWISVAVITLMDELTSVFYVPAEAHRFIGTSAIFYIAITSLFIRFLSTRLVEISEILEHHGLIGGGVYSFSYLVLGPTVSFIAVASIMVDYILTACISAVSAVLNSLYFFPLLTRSHQSEIGLVLGIIWLIAGLNILGIRENARFTFLIFIFAAFVFVNLIVSGLLALDADSVQRIRGAVTEGVSALESGSWLQSYGRFIAHIAFCILAYSGVESVLQTAGLVRSWQEIRKSYWFLALTVGIATPLLAALALSAPINFKEHEGDLITHYAVVVNGGAFGAVVAILASFTLMMAVNTAFVASSELLERAAHRYRLNWLIKTNGKNSLYRIHLMNSCLFSAIIFITQGSQAVLADMYAVGLLASFCINIGSLLIYRYFMGTKEVNHYYTSRLGTLIVWAVLMSCFFFLAVDKPHGTLLWATISAVVVIFGLAMSRKRAPELKEMAMAENEMSMIFQLANYEGADLRIIFMRPREEDLGAHRENEVFVTFYSPRQGIPKKLTSNHFRFPLTGSSLYQRIVAILKVVDYELPDRRIEVVIGWPMSSWHDRLAIGVMVFNLIRLPRLFPRIRFQMRYPGRRSGEEKVLQVVSDPSVEWVPIPPGSVAYGAPVYGSNSRQQREIS